MRSLLFPAVIALLAPSCSPSSPSTSDDPADPIAVLDEIEPRAGADLEIDPETLAHLALLAGEVGAVDFPSTAEVITRCEAGDVSACVSVGTRLMHGTWGLDKDAAAAVPLFEYACEAGEMEGCHSLAVALKYGRGVAEDVPRSITLFERACDGGNVVACSFFGDAYIHGQGVSRDVARGVDVYERACLQGALCRHVAVHTLTRLRSVPGAPFLAQDASPETACAGGDPAGCWWHALDLASEPDSDTTYTRIETLLTTACDAELADACASLGFHYLHRQSSPGYTARASAAFQRACDLGTACDHLKACPRDDPTRVLALSRGVSQAEQDCDDGQIPRCLSFAISLKTGNGVERDLERAVHLFDRVCASGDPSGCWYLGGAYKRGQGVPEDLARAASLHRQACDANYANGCVDLAFAHVHGYGVPQDLTTAITLFDKACTLGTACDHADHYRQQPTP